MIKVRTFLKQIHNEIRDIRVTFGFNTPESRALNHTETKINNYLNRTDKRHAKK